MLLTSGTGYTAWNQKNKYSPAAVEPFLKKALGRFLMVPKKIHDACLHGLIWLNKLAFSDMSCPMQHCHAACCSTG